MTSLPLSGLRVIDISTVLAGPNCARYLADYGADVIKVEKPGGDSLRRMAWTDERDGEGMWWKFANRNKRNVVLDLKDPADVDLLLRLVDDANVLVENFRPGTLERLGVGPDVLLARNERIVITRVSGFGQSGPYAQRPGFATIAEAMSGLAALSGEPDGQPLLPPIALTDEVTGITSAFATMVAVYSGRGQVVDVNLLETMFQLMGPLPTLFALTGALQPRLGAGLPYSVPRGTYRCADGRWIAVSTSSDTIAARVLAVLGVGDDARFATFAGRTRHRDDIESLFVSWCSGRASADVIRILTDAQAAVGPVMDMADIATDEHFLAREMITPVPDGPDVDPVDPARSRPEHPGPEHPGPEDSGPEHTGPEHTGMVTPMQALIARLSATPGAIRWAGRPLDADGAAIRERGWATFDRAAHDP